MEGTACLELRVTESHLNRDVSCLLAVVRPAWTPRDVSYKVFTNGITNKLMGCWLKEDTSDIVLIRIYGQNTDLLIDRDAETKNFKLLQKAGYAPRLYAVFKNGLAYEYVPGEILDVESVKAPAVFPLVARMLAKIHKVDCPTSGGPVLWPKLNKYLNLVPSTYSSPDKQALFTELFPEGITFFHSEVQNLENELGYLKSRVVFCHNDLLLANIIHNEDKVTFIDYEYAGCNFQAYDIGNHFAEFAGVSSVDYGNYPEREFQESWLRIYLEEFKSDSVTEEEIETLYIQVNKFALVSHLFWASWALVQAEHSTIYFDFIRTYLLLAHTEHISPDRSQRVKELCEYFKTVILGGLSRLDLLDIAPFLLELSCISAGRGER